MADILILSRAARLVIQREPVKNEGKTDVYWGFRESEAAVKAVKNNMFGDFKK